MQDRQSQMALMSDEQPGAASVSPNSSRLSALIDSAEDLIWSTDLGFCLTTFNRAASVGICDRVKVNSPGGLRPFEYLPTERASCRVGGAGCSVQLQLTEGGD